MYIQMLIFNYFKLPRYQYLVIFTCTWAIFYLSGNPPVSTRKFDILKELLLLVPSQPTICSTPVGINWNQHVQSTRKKRQDSLPSIVYQFVLTINTTCSLQDRADNTAYHAQYTSLYKQYSQFTVFKIEQTRQSTIYSTPVVMNKNHNSRSTR